MKVKCTVFLGSHLFLSERDRNGKITYLSIYLVVTVEVHDEGILQASFCISYHLTDHLRCLFYCLPLTPLSGIVVDHHQTHLLVLHSLYGDRAAAVEHCDSVEIWGVGSLRLWVINLALDSHTYYCLLFITFAPQPVNSTLTWKHVLARSLVIMFLLSSIYTGLVFPKASSPSSKMPCLQFLSSIHYPLAWHSSP